MHAVLTRLSVEQLPGDRDMTLRSPGMSAAARLFARPEACGCDATVADGSLELGGSLLVLKGRSFEIVLGHRSGNSSALGTTGSSAEKRA